MSRILIELSRAGCRQAIVAGQASPALVARVDEELSRAGRDIAVAWTAPDLLAGMLRGRAEEDLVAFGCTALVKADLLARFAADPGLERLRGAGRTVAMRTTAERLARQGREAMRPAAGAEGRVLEAGRGEITPLDDAGAAALAVLGETGKSSDGWVSRRLNRPVSRRISAALLRLGDVRPSHLTALGTAAAAGMFACLSLGGRPGLVVGCVLLHVASVLDGLDGEVARATFRSSAYGALMDTVVDMATNLLFILGLSIGLYRVHGTADALAGLVGLALWSSGVLLLAVLIRLGPRGGSFDVLKIAYARSLTGPVGAALVTLARNVLGRDFFALAFALMGLMGLYGAIPWIVAAAAGVWLVLIAAAAPMLLSSRPGVLQPDHLANGGRGLEVQPALALRSQTRGPENPLL